LDKVENKDNSIITDSKPPILRSSGAACKSGILVKH
jgi:hypothetical protein